MKKIVTVSMAMFLGFVMVSAAGSACCGAGRARVAPDVATAKAAVVADKAVEDVKKDLEPTIVCGKCGEVKGTKKCCKKAKTCKKCKLHKGSAGCCKMTADGANMVKCPTSGKLMACPLKDGKCDLESLKKACKAGDIKGCKAGNAKGCKVACTAANAKSCKVSAAACKLSGK